MKKTTFITTLFLLLSCTIFGMDLKEYNDLIAQAKKEILEYRLKVCREFIKGENYTTINDVAKELDISDMSVINSLIYRVKDEEKNKEE